MRIKPHVKVFAGVMPLAPLVDVVFLLLIFFMMSSSLVFWPGTRVETSVTLPKALADDRTAADKLITTITRSGVLFFNDRRVDWEGLERALNEEVHSSRLAVAKRRAEADDQRAQRSPLVVLREDESIPYGEIMKVMSLARSLGLGVYLVTASDDDEQRANSLMLGE